MVQRKAKYASHWEWTCKTCKRSGALERIGRIRSQKQFARLYQDATEDHTVVSKNRCNSPRIDVAQIDGRAYRTDA